MNYYDEIAKSYNELHKEEQLNKIKIVFDLDLIKPTDNVLDVGCGTGFSLDFFECKNIIGIDPSEKLISQYKGKNKIILGEAENLPFKDNEFDVVISFTAIQNFQDIEKGLREIKRVGKNKFALTFLKRSMKAEFIEKLIRKIFSEFKIENTKGKNVSCEPKTTVFKRIEEQKDFIFIIT